MGTSLTPQRIILYRKQLKLKKKTIIQIPVIKKQYSTWSISYEQNTEFFATHLENSLQEEDMLEEKILQDVENIMIQYKYKRTSCSICQHSQIPWPHVEKKERREKRDIRYKKIIGS